MYKKFMGGSLPKNVNDQIKPTKKELEIKIEKLYKNIQRNLIAGTWTQQDYQQLRKELGKLDENIFDEAFSFILEITDLNIEQIKELYLKVDRSFKLNIYINENKPAIEDITIILNQLNSRKLLLYNIVLNSYLNSLKERKNIQDEYQDLILLLEKMNNGDKDIIEMIKNQYQEFINSADNNLGLIEFLEIPTDELITLNKERLNRRIKKYCVSINHYSEIDDYRRQRSRGN